MANRQDSIRAIERIKATQQDFEAYEKWLNKAAPTALQHQTHKTRENYKKEIQRLSEKSSDFIKDVKKSYPSDFNAAKAPPSVAPSTVEGVLSASSRTDATTYFRHLETYRSLFDDLLGQYNELKRPYPGDHFVRRVMVVAGVFLVGFLVVVGVRQLDRYNTQRVYENGLAALEEERYSHALSHFRYTLYREHADSAMHLGSVYEGYVDQLLEETEIDAARELAMRYYEADLDSNRAGRLLTTTYVRPAQTLASEEEPNWEAVENVLLQLEALKVGLRLTGDGLDLYKQCRVERALQLEENDADPLEVRTMLQPITRRPPHTSRISRQGLAQYYDTYYDPAVIQFDEGNYEQARAEFTELVNEIVEINVLSSPGQAEYRDLQNQLAETYYQQADALTNEQDYTNAQSIWLALLEQRADYDLDPYRDAQDRWLNTFDLEARNLLANGEYAAARQAANAGIDAFTTRQGIDRESFDEDAVLQTLYKSYYHEARSNVDAEEWEQARGLLDNLFQEIAFFSGEEEEIVDYEGETGTARDLYADTYYLPAELAIEASDFTTALALLDELVALDRSSYRRTQSLRQQTYYALGSDALFSARLAGGDSQIEQLNTAIEMFELLGEINQSYNDAPTLLMESYYLRASLFSQAQDWENAQRLWTRAYEINPLYADTVTQLRLAYYTPASETLDEALSVLAEAGAQSPDELSEVTESCDAARDALSIEQPLSLIDFRETQSLVNEAIYCEIQVSLLIEDFAQAVASIEELNQMSPYYRNTPAVYNQALYGLAQQQMDAEEWQLARETLRRLLDNEPFYEDAPILYRDAFFIPAQNAFDNEDWEESRTHLIPLVYGSLSMGLVPIDPTYRDAQTLFYETYYTPGLTAFQAEDWDGAREQLLVLVEGEMFLDQALSLTQIAPDYRDTQRLFRDSYYIPGLRAYQAEEWLAASNEFEGLLKLLAQIEGATLAEVDYGDAPDANARLLLQESIYKLANERLEEDAYTRARSEAVRLLALQLELAPDNGATLGNVDYLPMTIGEDARSARVIYYDTYYEQAIDALQEDRYQTARESLIVLFDQIAADQSIDASVAEHRDARMVYYDTYYLPASAAFDDNDWDAARTGYEQLFSVIAADQDVSKDEVNHRDARLQYHDSFYRPAWVAFSERDWQTTRVTADALISQIAQENGIVASAVTYVGTLHHNAPPLLIEPRELSPTLLEEVETTDEETPIDIQVILRESYYIPGVDAINQQNWQIARDNLTSLFELDANYKDAQTQLQQSYLTPAREAVALEDWATARVNLTELLQIDADATDAVDLLIEAHLTPAQATFAAEDWESTREHIIPLRAWTRAPTGTRFAYLEVSQAMDEETRTTVETLYRESFLTPVQNLIDSADYSSARAALSLFRQAYPRETTLYQDILLSTYSVPFQTAVNHEDWRTASELYLTLAAEDPSDETRTLILAEHPSLRAALARVTAAYWTDVDYDLPTTNLLADSYGSTVNQITIAPFGQRIAYITSDGLLIIHDSVNSVPLVIRTSSDRLNQVAIHPYGDWVATLDYTGNVTVWDAVRGTALARLETDTPILSLSTTADAQLMTGDESGTLTFWTLNDNALQQNEDLSLAAPVAAITEANGTIVVGGLDGTITVIEQEELQATIEVTVPYIVTKIVPHPVDNTFVVIGLDSTITRWSVTGDLVETYIDHTDWVRDVAFNGDGGLMYSVDSDQRLLVTDTVTSEVVATELYLEERPHALGIAPDSLTVYLGGNQSASTTAGFMWTWQWHDSAP